MSTVKITRHKNKIESIASSFNRALSSLRTYSKNIGNLADEHDEYSVKTLNQYVDEFLSHSRPQPIATNESIEPTGEASAAEEESDADEVDEVGGTGKNTSQERRSQLIKFILPAARKLQDRLRNVHPTNGRILRNGAIISLVSCLESLMADLLHWACRLQPKVLASDDRQIKFSEILAHSSIDGVVD